MLTMKLERLNDQQLEALKGGFRDRIFNLNPQLNLGGAVAARGGCARHDHGNGREERRRQPQLRR
jgi:hypothetical protein